jgi:hypothetical protein
MSIFTRSEKRLAIELISILVSDYNEENNFGKAIFHT